MAPFGVVSLSSHDSEGAADMASFRWAQQASYGTVPNKAMPAAFMAHGFDLQDPWNGNTGACDTAAGGPSPFPGYDCHTPWYMGPGIHPRLKKPVGQRLALGALKEGYGLGGGATGGTIKGCAYDAASNTLTLGFNGFDSSGGRKLAVRSYNRTTTALSATAVMVNGTWFPVDITLGAKPGTVVVDLSKAASASASASAAAAALAPSAPSAVRYAWGGVGSGNNPTPNGDDVSCCEGNGVDKPCVPTQCPILAMEPAAPFGALPIDPFIAEIVGGKCLCPEPQMCSDAI